jgi:hypothetical protein
MGVGGGLHAAPPIPHALDGDQRDDEQDWSEIEQ